MAGTLSAEFLDRTSEREALDQLLAQVRDGQSAVLVIRGEAGIGKTELLRYVASHAAGFRVAQVLSAQVGRPQHCRNWAGDPGSGNLCRPSRGRHDPDPRTKAAA